jgi:phosphohistidine phosphatase
MKILILMRHAKSEQKSHHGSELDRPLTPKGEQRVELMGSWILERELLPQLVLTSNSLRATRTAQIFAQSSGYAGEIRVVKKLLMAEADELLKVLKELPEDLERVMIVGHNPGLESLIPMLTKRVEALPTASVAVLRLEIDAWKDLKPKTKAELMEIWRAKEIEKKE